MNRSIKIDAAISLAIVVVAAVLFSNGVGASTVSRGLNSGASPPDARSTSSTSAVASTTAIVLDYAPAKVSLTGTVAIESHFGRPGFGENPNIDQKEQIPVLVLDTPISVKGQPGTPNSDTFAEVDRLQLIATDALKTSSFQGQRVKVNGVLFEQQNAENYTKVIFIVGNISSDR